MNAYQLVPIPKSDNPWPEELRPYVEQESAFFCGRSTEREIILANLFSSRITVLHGPSGVGKSSILWAGVLPDVRAHARDSVLSDAPLAVGVYHRDWSNDPLRDVEHAIREALLAQGPSLAGDLEPEAAGLRHLLLDCTTHRGLHLFIILDQLEDIFTGCGAAELSRFRDEFSTTVSDGRIAVNFLLGIRQDWLGALEYLKESIPGVFDNSLTLSDLDEEGARAVIEEPVAAFNKLTADARAVRVDPDLTRTVLTQVREARRRFARSAISTPFSPDADGYPAAYLALIMRRLWKDKGDAAELGLGPLNSIQGGVGSIVQDHVDRVMNQFHIDDRTVAALALERLVTGMGATVDFPLKDLDVGDPSFSKQRLESVVDALEDRHRMVHSVGDGRYRVFHDLLIAPINHWLEDFRSTESYKGFPRVFHQALRIVRRAKRELWWVNFVLRFGEPHSNNLRTRAEYLRYTGQKFESDVEDFCRILLEKASQLDLVRVMTLTDDGVRDFLNGLRTWQKQDRDLSPDESITSETLQVRELLRKIHNSNRDLRRRLAEADRTSERSTSRQFFQTTSLPIQLIIADTGVDDELCCLAFMVGSEAYRAGEKREGLVGAHYTEDRALVDMYRNLAVVLMKQANVTAIWPAGLTNVQSLDIAGGLWSADAVVGT